VENIDQIPSDMKLTRAVQGFLDELGWEDEIELNPIEKTSCLDAKLGNEDVNCTLKIEVSEEKCWISVYLSNEITVTESRYTEACELVNGINAMLLIGSLCATVRRPFLYRQTIDLEGSEGSPTIVKNMVDVGFTVMRDWQAAMARVIFAKTTAKQIFAEDPPLGSRCHRQGTALRQDTSALNDSVAHLRCPERHLRILEAK